MGVGLGGALPAWAEEPAPPSPAPPAPAASPATPAPAPFGPGALVEVTSRARPVTVFVARRPPTSADVSNPRDVVKVGKTPIAFQLPAGSYRIEVEGVDVSNESVLFEMRHEPRRLKVRTGSEGLATAGTLLLGVGILGIAGATAILASGTRAPSKLDKASVLVPMYAAGAVCFGGGLAMSAAGSTTIDDEQPRPLPRRRNAWLGVRATF